MLLTRVTGSGQALCPSVEDNRTAVTNASTSMTVFLDLEEFSTYTATVTPTSNDSIPGFINFTTDTNGILYRAALL